MDLVSLFNPFSSKPIEHEDRLTWAFLVTCKYNPPLQNFLRELVLRETAESELSLENKDVIDSWKPANISTQKKNIQIESAPNSIVSVLLTDKPIKEKINVAWSDRKPIYDGIIEYSNGLILIIENKLWHGNVWRDQLSPNIESFPSELDVENSLHNQAVCLVWSEILEGVLGFINSKYATFGSSEIASDFLTFVEEIHPELTPYRTFKLCAGRPEALRIRKDKLHKDIVIVRNADGEESDCEFCDDYIYRKDRIAERIYFDCEKNQHLSVCLWPANIVTQAQELYDYFRKKGNEKFLNFANNDEWTFNSLLRFYSFNNKIDIQTEPDLPTADYLDYFADGNYIRQWRYEPNEGLGELTDFLHQLVNDELISEQELENIKEDFFGGKFTHMRVAPGFAISRAWNLDDIIEWEQDETLSLEDIMIKELNDLLDAWGEKL